MAFRIEIEHNDVLVEKTFEVDEIAIGRAESADIVLDDQTVSRKHARIRSQGDAHTLIVLSKNGMTALEGEQVHGEVSLEDGSILHFGTIKCVFHVVEVVPAVIVGSASEAATEKNPAVRVEDLADNVEGAGDKIAFEDAPTELRSAEKPHEVAESEESEESEEPEEAEEPNEPEDSGAKFEDAPTEFRPVEEAPAIEEPVEEPVEERPVGRARPRIKDHVSEVLISWEKIASSDEATREPTDDERVETNYQKIRKAAEKAEKQSSLNKLKVGLGAFLAVGLLAFAIFYEAGGPLLVDQPESAPTEIPPITFSPGEIDCASEAECLAEARRNYKIGIERLDNADAEISNRFDGWKRLMMVERYAEKAKLGSLPEEFSELEARKTTVRSELDEIYRRAQQSYHHHGQYKMYTEMVEVINSLKAHFPHEGAREFKWAMAQERQLKEQGNYPMHMRRKQQGRL